MAARANFGVNRVQVLPGNVGLFDLRGFFPKEFSAASIAAAMSLLANTDALIIDLRENGGGEPATIALLCSYLFPAGSRIHLNDIYDRPKNKTEQFWTDPNLPGPRYTGKPVYVLNSHRTFSGAEEFGYNMQTQKRATLVGETTGGGAHPGGLVALGSGLVAFVPTGRAINPITGTNWEGVGVKPDMPTTAAAALQTAHLHALSSLLKAENDAERRRNLQETVALLKKSPPAQP
jgi:C-terminal processing protease CtpA/Prc